MDHKFSEIDHVTPLFNLFLVEHLPTHSVSRSICKFLAIKKYPYTTHASGKLVTYINKEITFPKISSNIAYIKMNNDILFIIEPDDISRLGDFPANIPIRIS